MVLQSVSRRVIDRIPELLGYFRGASVSADILPYTREEFDRLRPTRLVRLLEHSIRLA